jgi:UDP-2,3-diacylglucosamine hydrolase
LTPSQETVLPGFLGRVENPRFASSADPYFGHTHRSMADYQFGGPTFHNSGAPIKGVKFRILEAVE